MHERRGHFLYILPQDTVNIWCLMMHLSVTLVDIFQQAEHSLIYKAKFVNQSAVVPV